MRSWCFRRRCFHAARCVLQEACRWPLRGRRRRRSSVWTTRTARVPSATTRPPPASTRSSSSSQTATSPALPSPPRSRPQVSGAPAAGQGHAPRSVVLPAAGQGHAPKSVVPLLRVKVMPPGQWCPRCAPRSCPQVSGAPSVV